MVIPARRHPAARQASAISWRDPGTLAIAVRLTSETTLPVKGIAARVQIGTAKGAKSALDLALQLAKAQRQLQP